MELTKNIYIVHHNGENFTQSEYYGFDISEAYYQFQSIDSQSLHESKCIYQIEVTQEFDDEFNEEDVEIEMFDYPNFNDDNIIEYGTFENDEINNSNKIFEIQSILSKKLNVKVSKYFSYNDLKYRIADHSHNSSLNHDFILSFLITNFDKTRQKFHVSKKTVDIDNSLSSEEIAEIIYKYIIN